MHYHWELAAAKKGTWPLSIAYIEQKSSVTLGRVSQNNSRVVYIASSESCEPKRFSGCWNKAERKCIQEQQPNQFHWYNQTMSFVNRMDQSLGNYGIGIRMKNDGLCFFEWQILFLRVRGYCIELTKMKAISLCLFQFFKDILSMQFFLNI